MPNQNWNLMIYVYVALNKYSRSDICFDTMSKPIYSLKNCSYWRLVCYIQIECSIDAERQSSRVVFYRFLKIHRKAVCRSLFLKNLNKWHWEAVIHSCSSKKVFFKRFSKTHREAPALSLFFDKKLNTCSFVKKRLWDRYILVNN